MPAKRQSQIIILNPVGNKQNVSSIGINKTKLGWLAFKQHNSGQY